MGASLGALAMLHAQRRHPRRVRRRCSCSPAASSSRAIDAHESRLPPLRRGSSRFVRDDAARRASTRSRCPSTLTVRHARRRTSHNNRAMARALAAQGYDVSLDEVPDMHNYIGWRDAFDPHLTAPARAPGRDERRATHELYSHAIGAHGAVVGLRALRPPGARLPVRGRQRLGLARQRHGRRASPTCSTAGRVKLYCVDSFDARVVVEPRRSRSRSARASTAATSRGSSTRSCRSSTHDCGGAQEIVTTGVSLGAYHAANFALKRADLFPLAIVPVGQLRPVDLGRAGASAARPPTSTTRSTTSRTSAATTSTGCARRLSLLLVCGQGQWEDTTGVARVHQAPRRRCSPRRASAHELDLWGHDVPHDWPSWRAQLAHHLPTVLLMSDDART